MLDIQSTKHIAQYTMHSTQCTVYNAQYTMQNTHTQLREAPGGPGNAHGFNNLWFFQFLVFCCFYPVLLRPPFFIGFNPCGGLLTGGGAYLRLVTHFKFRIVGPDQEIVMKQP